MKIYGLEINVETSRESLHSCPRESFLEVALPAYSKTCLKSYEMLEDNDSFDDDDFNRYLLGAIYQRMAEIGVGDGDFGWGCRVDEIRIDTKHKVETITFVLKD